MQLFHSISPLEWLRLILLYTHLLVSMLAIAGVLTTDLGLVTGKLERKRLCAMVRNMPRLLGVLWGTGLVIVWIDTGFAPAELQERSKLLVKILAVSVLTLNGLVLHRLCFPILLSAAPLNSRAAMLLAVTGSVSTMHWLLAAFIGVAKPLGRISIGNLLAGYLASVVVAIIVSIGCVPIVRSRVQVWRRSTDPAMQLDHTL